MLSSVSIFQEKKGHGLRICQSLSCQAKFVADGILKFYFYFYFFFFFLEKTNLQISYELSAKQDNSHEM